MQSALNRYLIEKEFNSKILKVQSFNGSRKVLDGKAKELRQQRMGKKKDASSAHDVSEESWRFCFP